MMFLHCFKKEKKKGKKKVKLCTWRKALAIFPKQSFLSSFWEVPSSSPHGDENLLMNIHGLRGFRLFTRMSLSTKITS